MTGQDPQTLEKIRSEYVEKSQKAKYNNMLASCSKLDQEIIKTLELLDKQSGGRLAHLYQIYNTIKQNS